jgi:DNA-binding PadR family transcriptional regulator
MSGIDLILRPHAFHILLALTRHDLHGAAIVDAVLARTGGRLRLWPATLYGALAELSDAGWIREVPPPADAPTEGGRRRFWRLTAAGRRAVVEEAERMATWVEVARGVEPGTA